MAAPAASTRVRSILTCIGTALVASGAAAINQVDERETDRLMERTRQRPVADGPDEPRPRADWSRRALSSDRPRCALARFERGGQLVALATLVTYALVYTPLKRRTSLSTVVGAVPRRLPPLIGWAGGRRIAGDARALGALRVHVPVAVAALPGHRVDLPRRYARAGLPMLPVIDRRMAR